MSLISRLVYRPLGKLLGEAMKAYYSNPASVLYDPGLDEFGRLEDFSEAQLRTLAMKTSWVYSDVSLISGMASKVEWEVFEEEEETAESSPPQVYGHAWPKLWKRPNPFMGGKALMQFTIGSLLLAGESYWFLAPPRVGQGLSEVWPMLPHRMAPIASGSDFISHYMYERVNGEPLKIPAENICFVRTYNPHNLRRGLSKLSAAQLAMESDYYASLYNRQWFGKKNAVPTHIISVPQGTQKSDFFRIRREIYDEFEERRSMVTRAGDIKVQSLSMSQRDMEYLSGREFSSKEIDRIFGIPEGFWRAIASEANARQAERVLIEQAVQPMLELVADEINTQVINRYYEPPVVEVRPSNLIPRDRVLELREFRTYSPIMSVNEGRMERGLPEWPDPEQGEEMIGILLGKKGSGAELGIQSEGGAGSEAADGISPTEASSAMKEWTRELKTYQRLAIRDLNSGEDPGDRVFESDYLADDVLERLKDALSGADTAEEVKAAFAAPFRKGWAGYP
jgi:HK97 family phage portal protein